MRNLESSSALFRPFRAKCRECSRMFSTFQQEDKPRGCCTEFTGNIAGDARGRVLLFEGLYARREEREDFIALLAMFSHCLDWILRGDGSRGGGIKKMVAVEGAKQKMSAAGKEERVYTNPLIL